jgi:hypothetical protein
MRKTIDSIFGSMGTFFVLLIAVMAAIALKVLGWQEGIPLIYFSVLAVDTPRTYELGNVNELPVKASTCIYEGAAVGDDAGGYMRGLVAGDPFRGFALRKADNSATATDGYINVKLMTKGLVELTITSIAITDVGKDVYASADGTFTLTAGSNSYIGKVYRYVTTNTCIVAFLAEGQTDGQLAAGATLASARLLVGSSGGVAAARDITGDVTITNSGVTAIGSGKVLTAMISSSQITAAKISDGAILEAAISSSQVTATKIGAAAVVSAHISTAQVISTHISESTITFGKFDSACLASIRSLVSSLISVHSG